jgi:hypothetical protein
MSGRFGPITMIFSKQTWRCAAALLLSSLAYAAVERLDPDQWRRLLETDWVLRAEVLAATNRPVELTPAADAMGGCDGIKNGRWGFHTDLATNPWWQVDLGETHALKQILVWNRCDDDKAARKGTNLVARLSSDGRDWSAAYVHDGQIFLGHRDNKPLAVDLFGQSARFVRLQIEGTNHLHLDEVEVFGTADPGRNLALHQPADQISLSPWSVDHRPPPPVNWETATRTTLERCRQLRAERRSDGRLTDSQNETLARLSGAAADGIPADGWRALFLEARRLQRQLALANPALDIDTLLFTKRVPPSFNHMSDQYYGWWSRPGGGLYLLRDFRTEAPTVECISGAFDRPGSFLRPTLSPDGRKILFAWCRYYPQLAGETNKLDKANVPADACYHLFEMNLDGSGVRQLTFGAYDDFDGRYLPGGRIVFLSTRRGQFLQVNRRTAAQSLARQDLPDIYVRCGGDAARPVAVYTLHTMNPDGTDLCPISPFEMFEWTPEIGHDGAILYSRWDYVDRDNMPYMGLWSIRPDGSNARIVYKNYTRTPHCAFEPRPVPNSRKIVFTASAHHSQTMGSLVLLDPAQGTEGKAPLERLTPEVVFPEAEGWPTTSYADPWPLSERDYLVAWTKEGRDVPGPDGWDRWQAIKRPPNGMGLYFYDAEIGPELLYRDSEIGCVEPIPVRPPPAPPAVASTVDWDGPQVGNFLLTDVTRGLTNVAPGDIKALRIVAVPPKTQPVKNDPIMGLTTDDPGKCVLGTVPVESDGSAYFRVPSGVMVFFQALDAQGMAVQTMRSSSHVLPGQTLGCIGCHDQRTLAPPPRLVLATRRTPSKLTPGPEGSWPLRFDRLVQPVLDRHCVECHRPNGPEPQAAKLDLTPKAAYDTLVGAGKPSLRDHVMAAYARGTSAAGAGAARTSAVLAALRDKGPHRDLVLNPDDLSRLITWMDTYAQRLGSFDEGQERQLVEFRDAIADLLEARRGP